MALSDQDRLRLYLGEKIPPGGSESDTMFTASQLQDFLDQSEADSEDKQYHSLFFHRDRHSWVLIKGAIYGWQAKAAEYSNLVDVAEGNSSRAMSDLYRAALAMVKFYKDQLDDDSSLGGRRGRVVIGTISRAGQGRR